MPAAFVARWSRWRLALIVAAGAGFIAFLLLATGVFGPSPPMPPLTRLLSAIVLPFFVIATAIRARCLFSAADAIRVDENGILWPQWSDQLIPWSAIQSVATARLRTQALVCLTLFDPDRYPAKSPLLRLGRGSSKAAGFGDIAMTTTGTDATSEQLHEAIRRFRPGL